MKKYSSAREAKELAYESRSNPELDYFFSWVVEEAKKGNLKGSFDKPGPDMHFDDDDIKLIRGLGYSIFWNRSCLWYEVDWSDKEVE